MATIHHPRLVLAGSGQLYHSSVMRSSIESIIAVDNLFVLPAFSLRARDCQKVRRTDRKSATNLFVVEILCAAGSCSSSPGCARNHRYCAEFTHCPSVQRITPVYESPA